MAIAEHIDILDLGSIFIGHEQDEQAATGCTVILVPAGATAGVDVRGGAPATRETDLLNPMNMVDRIHAVLLSGGSAYGLDAAGGVMRFLEEQGVGFPAGPHVVPIVCAASLFDLHLGDGSVRPDGAMGYRACQQAWEGRRPREGNQGAGTGATVGKCMGPQRMMKGGIGIAALAAGPLKVGAVVAVNALGDVVDLDSGAFLAGLRSEDGLRADDSCKRILENAAQSKDYFSGNTTIGCVLTNMKMDKAQANKLAAAAHNGLAAVIRPVHTSSDGDTIFSLALGEVEADALAAAVLAREATALAINRAIRQAQTAYGIPAWDDLG